MIVNIENVYHSLINNVSIIHKELIVNTTRHENYAHVFPVSWSPNFLYKFVFKSDRTSIENNSYIVD